MLIGHINKPIIRDHLRSSRMVKNNKYAIVQLSQDILYVFQIVAFIINIYFRSIFSYRFRPAAAIFRQNTDINEYFLSKMSSKIFYIRGLFSI